MSGYNPDTGVFELTATKAGYWFRRDVLPASCAAKQGMELYAELLRHFGIEVVKLSSNYLHARGTPGQIWTALSGQPSNPDHERHYVRNPALGAKTASLAGDGVKKLPVDALRIFRSGIDGSGVPVGEAIASGRSSCRICGHLIAKGVQCLQGGYDFTGGLNGPQPTKCYVHRECLFPATTPSG